MRPRRLASPLALIAAPRVGALASRGARRRRARSALRRSGGDGADAPAGRGGILLGARPRRAHRADRRPLPAAGSRHGGPLSRRLGRAGRHSGRGDARASAIPPGRDPGPGRSRSTSRWSGPRVPSTTVSSGRRWRPAKDLRSAIPVILTGFGATREGDWKSGGALRAVTLAVRAAGLDRSGLGRRSRRPPRGRLFGRFRGADLVRRRRDRRRHRGLGAGAERPRLRRAHPGPEARAAQILDRRGEADALDGD